MSGRTTVMKARGIDPVLADEVERTRMIDAHEHLDEEAVRLRQPNNLTRFFMYYSFADLVSAGLPDKAQGRFFAEDITGEEQWRLIRDYWPLARNTGFCRAITISTKELYGIDDLDDGTIKPLLAAVAKRNRPGVLSWMIREKSGIETCLVGAEDPGDFSRRTAHPGLFIFDIAGTAFEVGKGDFSRFEKTSGIRVRTLLDWKKLVEWALGRWGKQASGIKFLHGYWRVLRHEDVPESVAAPLFEKCVARKKGLAPKERTALDDFVVHYLVKRAADLGLPVRFHTGYLGGNNYADLSYSRVRDLANLFRAYPKVRIDIYHLSYPEWMDVVTLAKHFSNVYANMCWAWIIDPVASLEFARSAIRALPSNKVLGFGGDFGYADVVYGHSRIARDGIAQVMSEAVREGWLTRVDAKAMVRRWLHDNAMELFRLEERKRVQAKGVPPALAV